LFAILIVVVIADATRVCIKAIRSREPLPTTEVPAEESQIRAPSGLFARREELEPAGRA
jgi:carbon starvation protein